MEAGMKLCTKCNHEQSTTQFCKHPRTKDRLQSWCRSCTNMASKESQGMKRVHIREVKDLLKHGELGFQIAMKELQEQFQNKAHALFVQYHKNTAKVLFTYDGGPHGKTI